MASVIFNKALVFLSTAEGIGSTATSTSGGSAYDLSQYITRVRLTRTFDLHDDTRMGHTAHSRIAGLEDWTAELELLQHFASTEILQTGGVNPTSIDKLLASIVGIKSQVAVRLTTADRSSDNPEYSGAVILESYTPMDGAVGDLLKTTVPFRSAGNLSRYVSSS